MAISVGEPKFSDFSFEISATPTEYHLSPHLPRRPVSCWQVTHHGVVPEGRTVTGGKQQPWDKAVTLQMEELGLPGTW